MCHNLLIGVFETYIIPSRSTQTITYNKPISNETVSHWIKNFMATAGIDTNQYKSHSTRAASTSHLASRDYDIKDILSAAGWSKEETFRRFYHFDSEKFGRELMNTLTL